MKLTNVWVNKLSTGLAASIKDKDGNYIPVRTTAGTKPFTEVGCFEIEGKDVFLGANQTTGTPVYRVKGEYTIKRITFKAELDEVHE